MTARDIDIGSGVTLRYVCWAPDRALNPQYDGIPDVDRYGAILAHPLPGAPDTGEGPGRCVGFITFDGDVARRIEPARPRWTVEAWEPLTIAPSVLCGCGFHGFIRGGRWVSA